jgi:hypothetical protein
VGRSRAPRGAGHRQSVRHEDLLFVYLRILEALDPERVVEDLAALAHPYQPVLLCWEKPPLTASNWCHRRLAAEWLEGKPGMSVQEIYDHRLAAPRRSPWPRR